MRPAGAPILNPLARRTRERQGIPVLRGAFPVIGHLPAYASDPLEMERIGVREVGRLFWTDAGFGTWHLRCLVPESFDLFRNVVTSSDYVREVVPELFGTSMIAQDGAKHRHLRSAMSPAFTPKGLGAAQVGALFAEIIERHIARWIELGSIALLPSTRELVLALILRMLGVAEPDLSGWRRDYEDYMLLGLNVPIDVPGSPRRRGLRARARLDDRIGALVHAARERPEAPGMLAALVQARDENGEALAHRELVDNLRLLILAGHETTATVLAWLLATLAERPELGERLREEAVAAELPRAPADLRKFPFAEALFREVIRLHPPVAHDMRRAMREIDLAGHRVPEGALCVISIEHLGRDPSLFPDPESFLPERWLSRTQAPTPIELAQFGGGPHFCLGYHLAWLEVVQFSVILSRLLHARSRRVALEGRPPLARHLPLRHPDPKARIRFL